MRLTKVFFKERNKTNYAIFTNTNKPWTKHMLCSNVYILGKSLLLISPESCSKDLPYILELNSFVHMTEHLKDI